MNQEHKNNIEKPTKIPINNKCKKVYSCNYKDTNRTISYLSDHR